MQEQRRERKRERERGGRERERERERERGRKREKETEVERIERLAVLNNSAILAIDFTLKAAFVGCDLNQMRQRDDINKDAAEELNGILFLFVIFF